MLKCIKKVLVFVESPFQLNSLLDLAECEPKIEFTVIARLNGDTKNDAAINRIVKNRERSNVKVETIKISRTGKAKYTELLKLLPWITAVFNASHVIFYDDRSLVYKTLSRLVRGAIILADDGAYSFVKIVELEQNQDKSIAGFITRFDGLQSEFVDIIHVPYKKTKLKPRAYSVIVGMPLFEKGIISKKAHVEVIYQIVERISKYSGSNVYYFPHRSEFVYRDLDLKVIESELSIEEYVQSVSDNAPSEIASMYSTALFVLSSKFIGLECFYYRIPDHELCDKKHARNIEIVYKALEQSECKELL